MCVKKRSKNSYGSYSFFFPLRVSCSETWFKHFFLGALNSGRCEKACFLYIEDFFVCTIFFLSVRWCSVTKSEFHSFFVIHWNRFSFEFLLNATAYCVYRECAFDCMTTTESSGNENRWLNKQCFDCAYGINWLKLM